MRVNGQRVLLCSCEDTMPLDGAAIAAALGASEVPRPCRALCQEDRGLFQAALAEGTPLLVGCTHQAPLFEELAAAADAAPPLAFVNLRETAGWSDEADRAAPKIAALIAEAALDLAPTPTLELSSDGSVLVLGPAEAALAAAGRLAGEDRAVTCVITGTDAATAPPTVRRFAVLGGRVERVSGHLGGFAATLAGATPLRPSSRGALAFPAGGAEAPVTVTADLMLDLRGGPSPFPAGRDGYERVEPSDALGLERALGRLLGLVGGFEKPRFVRVDPSLCAHSRNGKTGCTRCLEVCPTSSILPQGDHVLVHLASCDGHGGCAAVCPTGAIQYDLPAANGLYERLRAVLRTLRTAPSGATAHPGTAGAAAPVLLVHDTRHGAPLIDALAHHGPGLPAAVVPFAVASVEVIGLPFLAAALAYGAGAVAVLADPAARDRTLPAEAAMAQLRAILDGLGYGAAGQPRGPALAVLSLADPLALRPALDELAPAALAGPSSFAPMGKPRAIAGLALAHLHARAPAPVPAVALPAGAPYGAILVDTERCTLCLACVSVCPTRAIEDSREKPQLAFRESACVQCGLCRVTCPEAAIALAPRLTFGPAADRRVVVKEEEPYHCIRCGKPFGTESSITRILERLQGHAMFQEGGKLDLIKMCDDCRVIRQYETGSDAFGGLSGQAAPAGPKTSEDYFTERGQGTPDKR